MKRLLSYKELVGLDKTVSFCRERIKRGNFPKVTLYAGEEGIGKTSLIFLNAMALTCEDESCETKPCLKCGSCKDAIKNLMEHGTSSTNIKVFKMSIEGGKDSAAESLKYLNTNLTSGGARVVIYEECHRMRPEAQDVLLTPLEFLPNEVYVMFATTDILAINKALLSRMLQIPMPTPNRDDIVVLLQKEIERRNIHNKGGRPVLEMIADWSGNKPRASLQMLEAIGDDGTIHEDEIVGFLNKISIEEIAGILTNIEGSLVRGVDLILNLKLDPVSTKYLQTVLIEAIKLKDHGRSSKISQKDYRLLLSAISDVPTWKLIEFLYDITSVDVLTNQRIVSAFIKNHHLRNMFLEHDKETIRKEEAVQEINELEIPAGVEQKPPILESLLNSGTVIE